MKNLTLLTLVISLFSFKGIAQRNLTLNQNLKPFKIEEAMEGKVFKKDAGSVTVKFSKNSLSSNSIKPKISELNDPKCLTIEETKGLKIESEIVVADGTRAIQLMPGIVISGEKLLNTGQFIYQNMANRKAIELSTTSSSVRNNRISIPASSDLPNNQTMESVLRSRVAQFTSTNNLVQGNFPSRGSQFSTYTSTLTESTGLNIGASFFYMVGGAQAQFNFSSDSYKFMYVCNVEQLCLPIFSNQINKPSDVFTDNTSANDDLLYVRSVNYGRRLYVILESEFDLEKYDANFSANMDYGALKSNIESHINNERFSSKTNLKVLTQGGQPFPISSSDYAIILQKIDEYFSIPSNTIDLVPLSYMLTDLNGNPVSMTSFANFRGKNCVDQNKIKINVSSLQVTNSKNPNKVDKIFGSVDVRLFNGNQLVAADGISPLPPTFNFTRQIKIATKEDPFFMSNQGEDGEGTRNLNLNTELKFPTLDLRLQIIPKITEKRNNAADLDFVTDEKFNMSIRNMLINGEGNMVFDFRSGEITYKLFMNVSIH